MNLNQPDAGFHPAHQSLYPTMDSVVEAIKYIESLAPLKTPNEIFPLLMMYHNTLLKEIHTHPCQLIVLPTWRQTKE